MKMVYVRTITPLEDLSCVTLAVLFWEWQNAAEFFRSVVTLFLSRFFFVVVVVLAIFWEWQIAGLFFIYSFSPLAGLP